jgi:UDP-glucose 4-epimerase
MGTDIMGTSHVLEFARRCSAKVIYAGSSSAYAGPMLNPYAFAKYTGEQLCELYNKVYGLSTVTARFFNVYGERQPRSGPYATVVGVFEKQALNNKPLTVTGTGEQKRDFTHVSDIVRGFEALGKHEWNASVFQLGTGKNYSINELAKFFGDVISYVPTRPGEAWVTLADITEMKEETGWAPQIDLEDYIFDWKNENLK